MASARPAGLVVMCAAPFAAATLMAAEPGASVAEQVFVDRLRALVEARRWADAARHVQQAQALRPVPEWLGRSDGDVRLAQIRIGLGQLDVPAAVTAARFFLNGDEARSQQVLAIARGAHAAGDVAAAVALAKEILHRSPDFAAAERALAEWEPVTEKRAPAKKGNAADGAGRGHDAARATAERAGGGQPPRDAGGGPAFSDRRSRARDPAAGSGARVFRAGAPGGGGAADARSRAPDAGFSAGGAPTSGISGGGEKVTDPHVRLFAQALVTTG